MCRSNLIFDLDVSYSAMHSYLGPRRPHSRCIIPIHHTNIEVLLRLEMVQRLKIRKTPKDASDVREDNS